jgi:PAS domain S-box-containing protein
MADMVQSEQNLAEEDPAGRNVPTPESVLKSDEKKRTTPFESSLREGWDALRVRWEGGELDAWMEPLPPRFRDKFQREMALLLQRVGKWMIAVLRGDTAPDSELPGFRIAHPLHASRCLSRFRDLLLKRLLIDGAEPVSSQQVLELNDLFQRVFDRLSTFVTKKLTSLREKNRSLLKNARDIKGVLENLTDGVIFTDRRGTILEVNRTMEQKTGLPRERIVGRSYREIWPSTESLNWAEIFGQVLREGVTSILYDVEYKTPSAGESLVFDLVIAPHWVEGNLVGAITTVHFRTEQRKLEMELLHSEKMISIGRLTSGITHEFNNFIGGIKAYADLALTEGGEALTTRALEKIFRVSEKAERLTQALLSFSRKNVPNPEPTDITGALEETLELAERRIEDNDVHVVRSWSPVPKIIVDAAQIQQVFLNLIVNACDAMVAEGGTLTIAVGREGDDLRIRFSDTGCGIKRENLPRIFDPFFTTKQTGREGSAHGVGLGLSVSRGIVERHGGRLLAESEEGVGTTFVVQLPVVTSVKKPRIGALPAAERPSSRLAKLKKAKGVVAVLIIDDEEIICDFLEDMLRELGYQVRTARTFEKGRDLFRRDDYHFVFLDLLLPGMEVGPAVEAFRKIKPRVQIIIMTGRVLEEEDLEEIAALADSFVEKPFTASSILGTMRDLMTRKGITAR